MDLTRRELVDLALKAAALPGAAEFFAAWLKAAPDSEDAQHLHHAGSQAPPQPPLLVSYQPKFFDADDFAALQSFTEILIPTDEMPGAREAYCAYFIDFMLQSAEQVPDLQNRWRAAMAALKLAGFHAADAKGRAALMETISRPERDAAASHPAYAAYKLIKQLNTFAFYTSRAGMIDTLDYRGNTYNAEFPGCNHPEHRAVPMEGQTHAG